MKSKKRESVKSFQLKGGQFTLTRTRSPVKQRKAKERTGPTYTQKARTLTDKEISYEYILEQKVRAYKGAATELLWKYKARGAIIQKLLTAMTKLGFKISGNATGLKYNIMYSNAAVSDHLWTSVTGQTKKSGKK